MKMKKSKNLFLLATLMLGLNVCQVQASGITVKFNGDTVSYETVSPTIEGNYVVVPIRETAELLGIETIWDAENATMTFEKNSILSYHRILSKNVTVNSVFNTYDAPSTIINNYTVMPIRMVADILGADISWNPETQTVFITAEEPSPITDITLDKTLLEVDDIIDFTITTDFSVTSIKLVDANEEFLYESSEFVDLSEKRIFNFTYAPTTPSNLLTKWKIIPGFEAGYDDSLLFDVPVTISDRLEIHSVDIDKLMVMKIPNHVMTVTTSSAVSSIKVTDNLNRDIAYFDSYKKSGDERIFTINIEDQGFENNPIYTLTPMNGELAGEPFSEIKINQNDITSDTAVHFVEINRYNLNQSQVLEMHLLTDSDVVLFNFATANGEKIPMFGEHHISYLQNMNPAYFDHVLMPNGFKEYKMFFHISDIEDEILTIYSFDDDDNYSIKTINVIDDTYYVSPLITVDSDVNYHGNKNKASLDIKTSVNVTHILVTDPNGNEVGTYAAHFQDVDDHRFHDFFVNFDITESGIYKVTALMSNKFKDYDEYGEEVLHSKFIELNLLK